MNPLDGKDNNNYFFFPKLPIYLCINRALRCINFIHNYIINGIF